MRIKNGTLILVADGAKMLVYRNDGGVDDLDLKVLEHGEAEKLATHEQGSDTPGRTQASAGERRSSYEETDWQQQAEDEFARAAAGALEKCAAGSSGSDVVIAAAPRTLGTLRKYYGNQTKARLIGEIDKDLAHCVKQDVAAVVSSHGEG
ncbi:host attachment protein [Alteraurantiacibacter aquimixticola]|uniref:Host attachment protein n=1 Tax=Alteraurantiacibacter aquimixticola TaxID=2489173 RepID=A0A4T3F377_9SPHN|nr:host attachment protein [Alteraurantiacibacter aquimixticola]TIX50590.1 host attachment protein [Alteraurantiacibacter aquimixticola]